MRFRVRLKQAESTQEMCPDVASLCVYSEDALETSPEGRHGWSVSMQQVVIVLQPVRQNVVGNDSPPALPHLGVKRVY